MESAVNMTAMNVREAAGAERDAAAQLLGQYAERAGTLPGADDPQLRAWRDDAMTAFAARGLPHRRVEEWKYSDLRSVMREAYAPADGEVSVTAAQIADALGDATSIDAAKLVLVNGRFRPDLSDLGGEIKGAELKTLAAALAAPGSAVAAAISGANRQEGDVVALLNAGFMTDGIVLRIADKAELPRPVHLIHVAAGEAPASAALRNLIVLGAGSAATFIESYISTGSAGAQLNSVTDIRVADGARLRHCKISGENGNTQHLATALVELGADADYQAVNFADGDAFARHQTFLRFGGENACAHFYGAQLLRDRQHCDMTLVIDHDAVGCESREHVKAVLADQSQGIFQAKVIVRPGAQQTDGRQMAQGLLLSETAEFDAKPELEIYADDVKCNHGATSGALDEDLMFYLRARGIPEDQAKSLLIQAFVGEVLDKVEHEGLRDALTARAARWLR
jgi:Fe-S cluster assembly protein SufD